MRLLGTAVVASVPADFKDDVAFTLKKAVDDAAKAAAKKARTEALQDSARAAASVRGGAGVAFRGPLARGESQTRTLHTVRGETRASALQRQTEGKQPCRDTVRGGENLRRDPLEGGGRGTETD